MLRSTKRLIPTVIIAFWLIMAGMLVYREAIVPRLYRGTASNRTDLPQALWMGLFFGEEQRVGFVHLRTTPEDRQDEKGYALAATARVEFPLFGKDTRFHLSGNAWQSALYGLREFDFTLRAGDHEMRIEGAARDGVVNAVMHTAGETIPFSLPVGKELLLSGGMGLTAASMPSLEPGEVVYMDTFDPTTMAVGKAKLEALGRETLTVAGAPVETTVIATTIAGITTRAWVSQEEEIIRAETPFGLIIKKITPEEALAPGKDGTGDNILETLAVRPTGSTPDPDSQRMRIRISGLDDTLALPEDTRQRREGDSWILERQVPGVTDTVEPFSAADAEAYLAPDMFVQSGHPRIKQAAAEIVGDATDPWTTAVRLHDWVYENIIKENVLSVPSALDVLDVRRGDCNEHSVLFTALARASGIPARIVIGLAWSEQMQVFGYHAWPEVYIGRWIAMDPTFGEHTASPAHIKLFTGGIDQWPRLMAYIGKIRIEVLETR